VDTATPVAMREGDDKTVLSHGAASATWRELSKPSVTRSETIRRCVANLRKKGVLEVYDTISYYFVRYRQKIQCTVNIAHLLTITKYIFTPPLTDAILTLPHQFKQIRADTCRQPLLSVIATSGKPSIHPSPQPPPKSAVTPHAL